MKSATGIYKANFPQNNTVPSSKAVSSDPLLHKIATSFGFNEKETQELVRETLSESNKNYFSKHETLQRIRLARIMVRKCVFKISSALFNQSFTGSNSFTSSSVRETSVMPLSFRAAYILFYLINFSETEIAEILNISTLQVKERLGKSLLYLAKH